MIRILTIEQEDIKSYFEVIFDNIKTSSCYSFILDIFEDIKDCISLFKKANKNIPLNCKKFESLDDFYKSERDYALDFIIYIEEKLPLLQTA